MWERPSRPGGQFRARPRLSSSRRGRRASPSKSLQASSLESSSLHGTSPLLPPPASIARGTRGLTFVNLPGCSSSLLAPSPVLKVASPSRYLVRFLRPFFFFFGCYHQSFSCALSFLSCSHAMGKSSRGFRVPTATRVGGIMKRKEVSFMKGVKSSKMRECVEVLIRK